MSLVPVTPAEAPAMSYPRPRLRLHDDLVAAATAACDLTTATQSLVFWLTYGTGGTLWSLPGASYEDVLGDLPGQIDRHAARCADATKDIWNELIAAGGPYADDALDACCAHHAAMLYAWNVRHQLETVAYVFARRGDDTPSLQVLSAERLRGRWDKIIAGLQRGHGSWFDRFPEGNRITQALAVEAVRVQAARGPGRVGRPPAIEAGELRTDFVPLTGWAAITQALNRALGERRLLLRGEPFRALVRKLNEENDGPIVMPDKQGGQPRVDEARLVAWWQSLTDQFDRRVAERADRAESARAMAADTHPHGRAGEVAPGVRGGVKKRRGKK